MPGEPTPWVAGLIAVANVVARFLMAVFLVLQNAFVLWLVLTQKTDPSAKDMIIAIVNGSGVLAGVGVQYYLGSSASSVAKDHPLSK